MTRICALFFSLTTISTMAVAQSAPAAAQSVAPATAIPEATAPAAATNAPAAISADSTAAPATAGAAAQSAGSMAAQSADAVAPQGTPADTSAAPVADSASTPAAAPITAKNAGVSYDEYQHLMNILFPVDHAVPPGLEYTMVLRFEPHLHPEAQLVVRKFHSGRVDATLYRVKVDNLWRDALQLHRSNPDASTAEIATGIPVVKVNVPVTGQMVAEWHKDLFPTLSKSFDRVRREDRRVQRTGKYDAISGGTRYEVWYIEGNDEFHAIGWDNEIDSVGTGNYALAKWANPIRLYADGHESGKLIAVNEGQPAMVKSVTYSETTTLPSAQDVAAAQALVNAMPAANLANGPVPHPSAIGPRTGGPPAMSSGAVMMAGASRPVQAPPLPRFKDAAAKKRHAHDLPAPEAYGAAETASDAPVGGGWSSATSVVAPR